MTGLERNAVSQDVASYARCFPYIDALQWRA